MKFKNRILRFVIRIKMMKNSIRFSPSILCLGITISIFILLVDYFAGNFSYPILDTSADLGLQAFFKEFRDTDENNDQLYTVNTSHDYALATTVEYGDTTGTTAVSDRAKVAEFLRIASKADYKYIILDIHFENTLFTPYDSLLYSQIGSMPRILFSKHRENIDENYGPPGETPETLMAIDRKGSFADYRSMWTDGFSRYEYIQDGKESIALRLYKDINGKSIRRTWWGGYVDSDGNLCRNLQFVPFPKSAILSKEKKGQYLHRFLGHQILDINTEKELINWLKDKIILIGNFDEDVHDTYIGSVPGPLIHYYGWRTLERGGHKINWWLELFLFVFYTVSLFFIMMPMPEYKPKSVLMVIVKAIIGWWLAFLILKTLIYWMFGLSLIAVIPTSVFVIVTIVVTVVKSEPWKNLRAKRAGLEIIASKA